MAMLASGAVAAEKKTYSYTCKGGGFSVTAVVDSSVGVDRWSKSEPVILQIGAEPPQTLIADPDAPDADSYKNKDYEVLRVEVIHHAHAQSLRHRHRHATPPAAIYLARGQAHETRGDFARALGDYQSALALAREASDGAMEWQSMTALGFLWAGRDYMQAGQWFRRASDQAAHLADPTMRARSLNRLGNWLLNTGRTEEGLQAHQEALKVFEERHDTQGIAETLDLLGPAHGMRGDRISAVERLGEAITLFRAINDTPSLMSSLAMRALQSTPGASETTLSPLRTRDDCLQDATEALRLARQMNSLAGQAFAENALAHTLLSFGDFGPALAHAREAARIAAEIGTSSGRSPAPMRWGASTCSCLRLLRLLPHWRPACHSHKSLAPSSGSPCSQRTSDERTS